MYRRFKDLRERIKEINQGGVHEYFYNGIDTIKTCELRIQAASLETFEDFLNVGCEKLSSDEVILILIGQGNRQGILLDFSQNPPMYMPYEQAFAIINKCLKGRIKKLSVVMDVSNWHNVYMPLYLSDQNFIETIFVYERESALSIFPVKKWIENVFEEKCHWGEATYKYYSGYHIDPHPVWWSLCKSKWEEYVKFPSIKSWSEFHNIYQKLVRCKEDSNRVYSKSLRKKRGTYYNQLAVREIQDYFNEEYLSEVYAEEVEKWLNELKICTDYYK